MEEARATRIGGVMRDARSLEIINPWPDREFAGIWTDVARRRCCARWCAMGRGIRVGIAGGTEESG